MALVDNSLICWRMAGWEKISPALNQLNMMNRMAGASQLDTDGAAVLTSPKTSPGAAKTFIKRPPSGMAGTAAGTGDGSDAGDMGSILLYG
jgi:hypothetical protein